MGAGKITGKRRYRDTHAPSFTYALGNRQALDLLRQITVYLKSYKAKRAALALSHYIALTPRNGKYTPSLRAAREQFIKALLSLSPPSSGTPLTEAALDAFVAELRAKDGAAAG